MVVFIATVLTACIKIATKVPGEYVWVNSFYPNDEAVVSPDQSLVTITDKSGNYYYLITFYAFNPNNIKDERQGFVISLENHDIVTARKAAEKKLLTMLGISKEVACSLSVTVNVAGDINDVVAGKNYGLSFCPDGKEFPLNWDQVVSQ